MRDARQETKKKSDVRKKQIPRYQKAIQLPSFHRPPGQPGFFPGLLFFPRFRRWPATSSEFADRLLVAGIMPVFRGRYGAVRMVW